VTGWQRTERWVALLTVVAAIAAFLGWVGAVATGSGGWSVLLLVIIIVVMLFALFWTVRPARIRWWSGLLVLLAAIGPTTFAFVTLAGPIAHVAGLFTLVAIWLSAATVGRRYEMPPIGG
jgi:uncharacterized membrane protein YtjA (UPF0391 family)